MRHDSFTELLEELGGERRINLSLDRFRRALADVGNPERNVHSVVIGGTNGKGTTTLLVSNVLRRAGHRVCTYLSPHLQNVTERFLTDLVPADYSALAALGGELAPVARKHSLTFFELLTLIAFVRAHREGARFHVLEVGLGGRLDATNVTDPIATAITNISLDHQAYLGDTPMQILMEKLGIVRPEGLLITGITEPRLLDRVEKHCMDLDAIYYFSKELKPEIRHRDWDGQELTLNGFPFRLTNPTPGAVESAATAFLLLRIAFPTIPIPRVAEAFAEVRNPGRLETVALRPRVVLSGDHNPAGVACLLESLKHLPHGRIITVCGFSPDKPYQQLHAELAKISDEITLTEVPRFAGRMPADYAATERDARAAVERAIAKAGPDDTVLVTGSLYLVGEMRKIWHPKVNFLDRM